MVVPAGSEPATFACEAGALPLSYETEWLTAARRRLRRGGTLARSGVGSEMHSSREVTRDLCGFGCVDYCRASHRVTISFRSTRM